MSNYLFIKEETKGKWDFKTYVYKFKYSEYVFESIKILFKSDRIKL